MNRNKFGVTLVAVLAALATLAVAPWWLLLVAVLVVVAYGAGVASYPALSAAWERRRGGVQGESQPAAELWSDPFDPLKGGAP